MSSHEAHKARPASTIALPQQVSKVLNFITVKCPHLAQGEERLRG
jgi:hypothetical protein